MIGCYAVSPITREVATAAAKSLQLCPTLYNPTDGSPPGSSVPGILQARRLEWVAIAFSNACMHAKSLQLCPTLCNSMDYNPPGSSVHGLLQARRLEWVAIPFSRGSFWPGIEPRSPVMQANSLPYEPPGKPQICASVQFSSVSQSC